MVDPNEAEKAGGYPGTTRLLHNELGKTATFATDSF